MAHEGRLVFPFFTCETPDTHAFVAQPVSAAINLITVLALAYVFTQAQSTPARAAIGSYIAFEAWHTFSHVKHLAGTIQTNVVHSLGYVISATTLAAILLTSGTASGPSGPSGPSSSPSPLFWIVLAAAIATDLVVWYNVGGIYTIFTGLSILAVIIVGLYPQLPDKLKRRLPFMLVGLALLAVLFVNEAKNCDAMMDAYKFPYHAAIEIVGFALFVALASSFIP